MTEGKRARLLGGTALGLAFGLATLSIPALAAAADAAATSAAEGAKADKPAGNEVEGLTIVGENDGGASGQAAEACRDSWHPRRVAILTPTGGRKDLNDYILEKTK